MTTKTRRDDDDGYGDDDDDDDIDDRLLKVAVLPVNKMLLFKILTSQSDI